MYGDHNEYFTNHTDRGQSYDGYESILSGNKHVQRSRGLPENNFLKSVPAEKERANNVAKIKVAVCFLPRVSFLVLNVTFSFIRKIRTLVHLTIAFWLKMSRSVAGSEETP